MRIKAVEKERAEPPQTNLTLQSGNASKKLDTARNHPWEPSGFIIGEKTQSENKTTKAQPEPAGGSETALSQP